MTKQGIYAELKTIQKMAWRDDDMMRQETLFDLQDRLADLMLRLAQDCGTEQDLASSFPWLYRAVVTVEVQS